MEYYSATRRNETLIHPMTYTDLKSILLSEISQPHTDKYCMALLIGGTQTRQIQRQDVE